MEQKTLRQFRQALDEGANVVPLARELPADLLTAVSAFLRLRKNGEPAFLLESVEGGDRAARYTFLGARPFETLSVRGGIATRRLSDGTASTLDGNPYLALGEHMKRYRATDGTDLPRFCGGAVGYVGYEMARHIEPAVRLHADDDDDEACLLLCRDVVVFDRVRHRLILVANAVVDGRSSSGCAYRSACDSLDELEERLSTAQGEALRPATRQARSPSSPPQELMGAEAFMAGVRVLKGHIRAGEIFQGVLSEALRAPLRCDPFAVYRALRTVNPSPYMFFIDMGEQTALGASPEMLVRVEGDYVETRPIAGTRPRGGTEVDDHRNEQALRRSVKERAEHLMLVDLSRNDVGRVSRAGSVRVGSFFDVERYSHVMHLVSSVHGRLKRGCSAWAAFAACFPAGTVTGAPKIRAMQLVGELEKAPRGLYAGAVLYCDFRGNLDSAIAIRSMMVRRHGAEAIATVQSGAGIVADSQPERELSEIRNKARAMWEAVRIAEEHS